MPLERITHTGAAPTTGLSAPISASQMSFTLISGAGYPTGSGGPFVIDIDAGLSTEEKVLCSSLSGNTVTVMAGGRGWDGTAPAAHAASVNNVTHVVTSAEADDANAHIYDTSRNDHTQYLSASGGTLTGLTINGNLAITGTIATPSSITANGLTVNGLTTLAGMNSSGDVNTSTKMTAKTFIGTVVEEAGNSITPDCFAGQEFYLDVTGAVTINNPLNSLGLDGLKMIIRIYSPGGSYSITWGSQFLSSGVATLPTATTAGRTIHLGFLWDQSRGSWIILAADTVGY
jgi:hypothetical protein